MFVQVIRARTSDRVGAYRLLDRWRDELSGGAPGWLGTTAGVSHSGELVVVARFESERAARTNSDRTEQGAWWQEFSKLLDTDPTFRNSEDVDTFFGGGADDAGFVQVVQATVTDRHRIRSALARMRELGREGIGRPELCGGLLVWHEDRRALTQVVYFTSEGEARRGESAPAPDEAREVGEQWDAATADVSFVDLRQPWMASP